MVFFICRYIYCSHNILLIYHILLENNKQIGKIYLIDSIKNNWYSTVKIYLLNRPIKINKISHNIYYDYFQLLPDILNITLNSDQSIVVIQEEDLEYNNIIKVFKNVSKTIIICKHNNNIILTNSMTNTKNLITIIFANLYKFINKLPTLTISFSNRKLNLMDSLEKLTDFNSISNEIKIERYDDLIYNN